MAIIVLLAAAPLNMSMITRVRLHHLMPHIYQWDKDEVYEELQWPEEANHPPWDLTVQKLRDACMTFPEATGLSWDALHPRAFCRLSDEVLQALGRVLAACEVLGEWGDVIKPVLSVLCPKLMADGDPSACSPL